MIPSSPPHQQQQQEGVVAVYGIEMQNRGHAALVRKVLVLSTVGALFAISNSLRSGIRTTSGDAATTTIYILLSVALGLLVPACGWLGAKQSNRNLMCCFCGCNLCSVIFAIIGLSGLIVLSTVFNDWRDECDAGDTYIKIDPYTADEEEYAVSDENMSITCDDIDSITGASSLPILIIIPIITIIFNGASFYYGYKLYSILGEGVVLGVPYTNTSPTAPAAAAGVWMGSTVGPQIVGCQDAGDNGYFMQIMIVGKFVRDSNNLTLQEANEMMINGGSTWSICHSFEVIGLVYSFGHLVGTTSLPLLSRFSYGILLKSYPYTVVMLLCQWIIWMVNSRIHFLPLYLQYILIFITGLLAGLTFLLIMYKVHSTYNEREKEPVVILIDTTVTLFIITTNATTYLLDNTFMPPFDNRGCASTR
ncbi:hypothetical protein FOZ60_012203 [Perkinsus olseni]|uniref:Uncharacterized protein n=1 Tax=Perkinsus olseni TaxID=32597 RepID=A0A7J6P9X6_PEROL|nr:hypothetical protein FOZ60_012203 [Perkinsus olseni]